MKRVWHNTQLIKGKLALSAQDRGLNLGDGVFETLAVNGGVALWRFEHLERMRQAAFELGLPFPEDRIEDAIDALTHRAKGSHVLRLTLTRGEGGRGLSSDISKPTLIGTLQPFDDTLRFKPAALMTSSVRRNLHSPSSRLKTLSYIDNILAAREAEAQGSDDALMLNTAGRVACCSIGNVFLEMDGALVTPSLGEAILPGVMRCNVIKLAKQAGLVVKERQVKIADIAKADGMFMTNSLRFVRNITKCDKKRFSAPSQVVDMIVRGLLNAEQEQMILNRGAR
jgi:branched-chain amino acid aminotransferase